MLFPSMPFLSLFLPAVISLYYILPASFRNFTLLAASIVFYAWGEPKYCFVMFLIVAANYAGPLLMTRYEKYRTVLFILTLLINFEVLFYFKYMDFLIENLYWITTSGPSPLQVALPVGISFYIFQSVSYLIDVYRREIPVQRDFCKLFLFIALFPQMIAGPILKYHDIAGQIDHREVDPGIFSFGVKRFIIGLAKKMLIANVMGAMADRVFGTENSIHYPAWMFWAGAAAYTFQIYYDFSGYSDMALGLGSMFGFRFPENFNYPYISRSISEFWHRWHISLSSWFKEYLYIPLGGNRVSRIRNVFNLLVVFLATGIWHGASWNFILWGLWHGSFIILEKLTGLHKREFSRTGRFCCHLYTISVFLFGWVLFRAETLADAAFYFRKMFDFTEKSPMMLHWRTCFDVEEFAVFVIAALCACPLFSTMIRDPRGDNGDYSGVRPAMRKTVFVNLWLAVLFLLSVAKIATSTCNPFIYFRF